MQLPFFGPRRNEVAATATDLITRYGLRAHDEASHLAELSARLRSRRHRVLYELAAREIETSFSEAQKRLGLRQDRHTNVPGYFMLTAPELANSRPHRNH